MLQALSRDTQAAVSDQVLLQENSFKSEGTKLSSTRERVPTPGLSRILGPAPKNEGIQHRRHTEPTAPQGHNRSTAGAGARSQQKSTQYYDYSEAFENSAALPLHMNTSRILVPDAGSIVPCDVERHRHGARVDFNPGPQEGYGYSQDHICDDNSTYADVVPGYVFSGPSHQHEWTGQGQRAHTMQGVPNPPSYLQHPRVPLQEYAYAEPYGAYPQVPRRLIHPPQHQNRGHGVCVYPYYKSYQGGYHGGRRCYMGRGDARRYSGDDHNATRYHGQYQDSGRHDGIFRDAERYRQSREDFKGHYPNEENMPPTLQGQGYCGPRHGTTQPHGRVQNVMKSCMPRGLGQGNRPNGRPAVQISRPISILAPRPVSSNIGRRLAENVLSINSDDMLPAELRNPHDRSSGARDDELPDFDPAPLGQGGSFLAQNTNLGLQFQVPRKAPEPGKKELRRPRLIARMDSTKAPASNAQIYVSPKNVDFKDTVVSRARTPYPADTLTELEYRGIIRAKPKAGSSADSQSITKREHKRWESAKAMFQSAKEDVKAKLGIKTKRVRKAEKLGYTPLTHQAKASIPSSGPQNYSFDNMPDQRWQRIEEWRLCTSDENGVAEGPYTEAEDLRVRDANGHRPNMTTAAGHAIACPGMKERLMHLKAKAFRSKPNLRERM